ncbi:hypothetical protein ACFJIW_21630 [Tahibacter sp. UC22_41]|uniref:hypothetical protein n=1 Tax=Tahibacter sp. UC22_41 TaxID=3350178 RepID=UPI0036DD3F0A
MNMKQSSTHNPSNRDNGKTGSGRAPEKSPAHGTAVDAAEPGSAGERRERAGDEQQPGKEKQRDSKR